MAKTRRNNPNITRTSNANVNHYSDDPNDYFRDANRSIDSTINKEVSNKESQGAVGTIRIVIEGDTPYLEVKSEQGWVKSTNTSASGFSFKK
tara:strand:- start:355 stop:630 length:276 start_codon:yes stop_codon:yes gene_type:complete